MRTVTSPTGSRRWWPPALALAAAGWGSNQFVPMIVLYREEWALAASQLSAMYALYAVGLLPALLSGGWMSDRIGRRIPVAIGLLVGLVGTGLLMAAASASEVALLHIGRLVTGAACGVIFGSGAAWVGELSAGSNPPAGPRRIVVAITTGFACGPLIAGIIAQWSPGPGVWAYVPHLALSLVALASVWAADDSARHQQSAERSSAVIEPLPWRLVLLFLLPLAPWVFGCAAIFLAYVTPLVAPAMGESALIFGAVAASVGAIAGVVAQPIARRFEVGGAWLVRVAMLCVIAGLLGAAVAVGLRSPVVAIVDSIILGAAYGFCQLCGLQRAQQASPATRLGAVTGIYQTLSYAGFAFPLVAALLQEQLAIAPVALLLGLVALAASTLVWVEIYARRN